MVFRGTLNNDKRWLFRFSSKLRCMISLWKPRASPEGHLRTGAWSLYLKGFIALAAGFNGMGVTRAI